MNLAHFGELLLALARLHVELSGNETIFRDTFQVRFHGVILLGRPHLTILKNRWEFSENEPINNELCMLSLNKYYKFFIPFFLQHLLSTDSMQVLS